MHYISTRFNQYHIFTICQSARFAGVSSPVIPICMAHQHIKTYHSPPRSLCFHPFHYPKWLKSRAFSGYPLVMTNITMENHHRNSGFTHETW